MSRINLKPGDYSDPVDFNQKIQNNINASDCDEIYFEPGVFIIGTNTIKIRGKKTIWGDTNLGEPLAKITGTSGYLMRWQINKFYPMPPATRLRKPYGINCGIFSILTKENVVIKDLALEHIPVPNPDMPGFTRQEIYSKQEIFEKLDRFLKPEDYFHGSATIAWFVDNDYPTSLTVDNCTIDTAATGGINIQSINSVNASGINPHDISITNCKIKAIPVIDRYFGMGGGNFCGVVLGNGYDAFVAFNRRPVDVRNSRFEVSNCRIDPQGYPAVAMFNYESNSASVFAINNNWIGFYPPKLGSGGDMPATAIGVLFGFFLPLTYPQGAVEISGNHINIGSYFDLKAPDGTIFNTISAAILLQERIDSAQPPVDRLIKDNEIKVSHKLPPANPAAEISVAAIIYEDVAPTVYGSLNKHVFIEKNVISGGVVVPPKWGICLKGSANDVKVLTNDLRNLTAQSAQIYAQRCLVSGTNIEEEPHNCEIAGNMLGKLDSSAGEAVILCQGNHNTLEANDFTNSNVPGWTSPNQIKPGEMGCVLMGNFSNDNNTTLKSGELPAKSKEQYLDLAPGQGNTYSLNP